MTRAPASPHLSPDDIDAWLADELPASLVAHLEHCPLCQERAYGERAVIAELAQLTRFAPSPAFADGVMARLAERRGPLGAQTVQVPAVQRPAALADALAAAAAAAGVPAPAAPAPAGGAPSRRRWAGRLARRRSLAVATTLVVALVGLMAGSIAWSLAHQATLASVGAWLAAEGSHWLWVGLRGAASNLLEQPWYGAVRSWMATPGRIALTAGLALAAYLTGILTLRRLMTAPTPRVADAGW
ncbi:MAG TPA: hypothetical protein VFS40_15075 [Gemmatimonadales bacterium]|nr:hypothetical protein [Gemmatimonadales bacterium]